jgi:hypothetical protein
MLATTPRLITPQVAALAARLVGGGAPTFVEVRRVDGAQLNECFGNVQAQIARFGGDIVHGWVFWEWSNVMVEAEFHAV